MRIVFPCLLISFLVACSIAPTTTPVVIHPSSTITAVSVTPSPMPIELLLPSKTFVPTLSATDAVARIQQLMKDNGGCSLPCWWGIIPGKTSWDEARTFLQSINATIVYASNTSQYSITFPTVSVGYSMSGEFDVDDVGIVKKISVSQNTSPFYLADFLSMAGKPDRIFLQVYPEQIDSVPPFILLLVYDDTHIVAQFITGATWHEWSVEGCPAPSHPSLTLYAPNIDVSAELDKKFELERSQGKAVPYKLLEESTGLNTNSFYRVFKKSIANNCIETPSELWKLKQ